MNKMFVNKNINTIFKETLVKEYHAILVRGDINRLEDKSDIDVVIPKDNFIRASNFFISTIQKSNWKLISYRKIPYLISIVITNPDLHKLESLKIDFFDGVGWCGEVNKNFDKDFFSSNYDESFLSSAITLVHKLTYAGYLSEKDTNSIKHNIHDAINFLNISDLISKEIVLKKQKISLIRKWHLRFRLSGHNLIFFPLWVIRILRKILIIKFLPIKSYQRIIFIVCSDNQVKTIKNQLISLYASSGDQIQPKLSLEAFISDKDKFSSTSTINFYLSIIKNKIYSYNKNLFLLINTNKKFNIFNMFFVKFGKYIDISSISSEACLTKLVNEVDIIISQHIKLSK